MNPALERVRKRIERVRRSAPDAYRLARLASPAIRVEPRLLRRLRLEFLSDADVGVEADLWFSALVGTRGTNRIVLDADVAAILREDLAAEPALFRRVHSVIEDTHRDLPETLRLEEHLVFLGLSPDDGSDAAIDTALRPAMRTLMEREDHARAVAQWVMRALPRSHPRVRSHRAAVTLMFTASALLGNRRILAELPETGVTLSGIPWALPPELLATQDPIGVELLQGGLRFIEAGTNDSDITLPPTNPRVVVVGWSHQGSRTLRLVEAEVGRFYSVDEDVGELTLWTLDGSEYILERVLAPDAATPGTDAPAPYCYVVMGFGKKTDFETGRVLDLDASYHNLIKPAVEAVGLKCMRADEILNPGALWEAQAYEHLLNADVVVVDLSTSNTTAYYELGIRHALRPHTTLIIAEDGIRSFPFRSPVLQYRHMGDDIGVSEVRSFQKVLTEAISGRLAQDPLETDSPVYQFLRLQPPRMGRSAHDAEGGATQQGSSSGTSGWSAEIQKKHGERSVLGAESASAGSAFHMDRRGTCYVTMGFGRKTDFETGRVLDLDASYHNLIKPAVEAAGLKCVRADEIIHSGLIDVPMYEQLLNADVVVADLSTSNREACYELGVRHALRPFHTFVVAEDGLKKFPFDVNHNFVRQYRHMGEDIGYGEVRRFTQLLTETIVQNLEKELPSIDSPVYTFLRDLTPPQAITPEGDDNEATRLRDELKQQAEEALRKADFEQAKRLFVALRERRRSEAPDEPEDSYIIQRHALATYKSRQPTDEAALREAAEILAVLDPETSGDPETRMLWGTVQKRLWEITRDRSYLDAAVGAYEQSFVLLNDHNSGINFAYLLQTRAVLSAQTAPEEAHADLGAARRMWRKVIDICDRELQRAEPGGAGASQSAMVEREPPVVAREQAAEDRFWILATKGEAHLGLGEREAFYAARAEMELLSPAPWMMESFDSQIAKLEDLLKQLPAAEPPPP